MRDNSLFYFLFFHHEKSTDLQGFWQRKKQICPFLCISASYFSLDYFNNSSAVGTSVINTFINPPVIAPLIASILSFP